MIYFKPWKEITVSLDYWTLHNEGEIKTFHDKQKLKQFTNTKPVLQKMLKGTSHTEEEDKFKHETMGKNKSH
jgi:hypothetical protein